MIYNEFKRNIGTVNWGDNVTTNIKVMLVDSTYAVNIDTHLTKADIDALLVEVSGTGYVVGGANLVGRTTTVDVVNDWCRYDATDIVWAASTITARAAIVYLDTGVANTSTLISFVDFGVDKVSSNGDFTIQWNTEGVFRIS